MEVDIVLRDGWSDIITTEPIPLNVLQKLGWHESNYQYTWRYREQGWNGWTYMIENGRFATPLFERIYKAFIEEGIHPSVKHELTPVETPNKELYDQICEKLSLRDYQKKIFLDVLYKRSGLIRAPTGSGKTHIGLAISLYALGMGEPVAILTPTIPILNQWVKRAKELGVDVGRYGGPKKYTDGDITVIGIQKASKKLPYELIEKFRYAGYLISDEIHLWGAESFKTTTQKYFSTVSHKYGMTATPFRSDNKDINYNAVMGEIIAGVSYTDMIEAGWIVAPLIRYAKLDGFIPITRWERKHYSGKSDRLGARQILIEDNYERNEMIIKFVKELIDEEKRQTIIFVNTERHASRLQEMGLDWVPLLWSKNKLKDQILQEFTDCEIPAVIGTTMINVGVDIPSASGAVMAGGGKSPVSYYQRIGRLLRPYPNAKENIKENALIYDFCDNMNSLTEDHAVTRAKVISEEKSFIVQSDNSRFLRIVETIGKWIK